jgi:hypothetical protein
MPTDVPFLRAFVVALFAAQMAAAAQGQTSTPAAADVPMADYLGLLAQIAPAAREGAEAYLQAVQHQCRLNLSSTQLRRAMSEGEGDPVLMGMIRASQLRDAKAIAEWAQRLDCKGLR